jgi:hypothetical protein
MPAKQSPQARSAALLRSEGWHVETVEQTIRKRLSSFKRDLCGAWDLIAFPTEERLRDTFLLVQVTSGSNHAARRDKIANEPRVAYCRMAGAILELHSWRKNAAGEWVCKREDLS